MKLVKYLCEIALLLAVTDLMLCAVWYEHTRQRPAALDDLAWAAVMLLMLIYSAVERRVLVKVEWHENRTLAIGAWGGALAVSSTFWNAVGIGATMFVIGCMWDAVFALIKHAWTHRCPRYTVRVR